MGPDKKSDNNNSAVRLDKWLFAARFYKTRKIARKMIEGGKIHYNGQRSKPSKIVEIGAILRLQQGIEEKTVTVLKLTEVRRTSADALRCYEETVDSIEKREKIALARKQNTLTMPHPERRPDKKERQLLIKLKHFD